jgi:hypothetical protein
VSGAKLEAPGSLGVDRDRFRARADRVDTARDRLMSWLGNPCGTALTKPSRSFAGINFGWRSDLFPVNESSLPRILGVIVYARLGRRGIRSIEGMRSKPRSHLFSVNESRRLSNPQARSSMAG